MSTRNFKLLIILITIILLVVLVSVLSKNTPIEDTATEEKKTNFFTDFLPFGKKDNNTEEENNTTDISNDGENYMEGENLLLRKISSMPISGFGIFLKERFVKIPEVVPPVVNNPEENMALAPTAPPTEFAVMARYAEKASGNVYQTFIDELNERKVSQTIVRGVHDMYLGDNGKSIIMRYLKGDGATIASFAGSLPEDSLGSDSSTNEIKGSFLPENIQNLSVAPNSSKIFYLSKIRDGMAGVVSSPLGREKVQVFDSPFTEWISQWPNENVITLTTKASGIAPGYMYAIDPNKKDWKRIIGGINGLTTLTSPDGRLVLYNDSSLTLNIYDTVTNEFRTLKIKTMPEKCVWGKSNRLLYCFVPNFIDEFLLYPDAWYQSEASFTDKIWKIDLTNIKEVMLFDPYTLLKGKERIDGINPTLDESENHLFFMNKRDSYLWELRIK